MSQENYFNNINDLDSGIKRVLGDGISTRIFCGDQSMLSIVTIEPNAKGQIHSHPQEQWGFLICLLYTSPSPRDATLSRMPSSA